MVRELPRAGELTAGRRASSGGPGSMSSWSEQRSDGALASLCSTDQAALRAAARGARTVGAGRRSPTCRRWCCRRRCGTPTCSWRRLDRAGPQWADRGEDGLRRSTGSDCGVRRAHRDRPGPGATRWPGCCPGLRIADRVELTDRFLRVRGDLRTYKIHLGSGNILMEPNDAYLCIVPGHGRGAEPASSCPSRRTAACCRSSCRRRSCSPTTRAITDRTITAQLRRDR